MASLKEIRRRISSIKNTRQITRAMKLVSAAKLRRAQDAAMHGRGYTENLNDVLGEVLKDLPSTFSHPALERHGNVKKRWIICIAGERGLCGPYNSNVFRRIYANEIDAGVALEFLPIGRRSVATAKRLGWTTVQKYEGLSEDATEWPVREIVEYCLNGFINGECDEVRVYYTHFNSAVSQSVVEKRLLPLCDLSDAISEARNSEPTVTETKIKYDPEPRMLFDDIFKIVLCSYMLQAGLESKASEHASRMTAMEAATSNADELLSKLMLFYNRARQSAITTELLDVLGGAEALG